MLSLVKVRTVDDTTIIMEQWRNHTDRGQWRNHTDRGHRSARTETSVSLCPPQILPGMGPVTDCLNLGTALQNLRLPQYCHLGFQPLDENSCLTNPLLCKYFAVLSSSWQLVLVSGSRHSHQTCQTRRFAITSCHLTQPKSV